ncbi:hypothetical protein [Paraliomyxa miuraensis]|uniref:hypothetical protein n=1 Tax=Paraliomyxa miuraensis TaxID=376150 RepID=UPI00225058EE|nr:hypothetical protein [Paraliomyxa miuraensis]MCX4243326.1 hypothetical protein [Paraliomyxa miuraensis]
MATLRSTPQAFERAPGLVAVTGPAVGASLTVLVSFAVLFADVPSWVEGWVAGCGVGLVLSGIIAWRVPSELVVATRLGLIVATVGLALGSPALGLWLRAAVSGTGLVMPDFVAFAAGTSILCACYLSVLAAHLVRNERIAADERRARIAAHASIVGVPMPPVA